MHSNRLIIFFLNAERAQCTFCSWQWCWWLFSVALRWQWRWNLVTTTALLFHCAETPVGVFFPAGLSLLFLFFLLPVCLSQFPSRYPLFLCFSVSVVSLSTLSISLSKQEYGNHFTLLHCKRTIKEENEAWYQNIIFLNYKGHLPNSLKDRGLKWIFQINCKVTVAMSRSHKLITLASNTTHKIV